MKPMLAVVDILRERFERMYQKAQMDHTVRTEIPAKEMLLATTHLMLAAVTRCAVGLVCEGGEDPEKELILLRNRLLREYTQMK